MYDEIIQKYTGITELETNRFDEVDKYRIFLEQTDYLTAKMSEDYISGKTKTEIKAKYGDIIAARQYCRDKINKMAVGDNL